VIELKSDWAKGYARLGNALAGAGKHGDAVKAFAAGLAYDPTSTALVDGIKLSSATPEGTKVGPGVSPVATKKSAPTADATANGKAPAAAEEAEGGGLVVGIDLGTTYSAVAVVRPGAGRVEMIPNANGGNTTASWVAFSKVCILVSAHPARAQRGISPYTQPTPHRQAGVSCAAPPPPRVFACCVFSLTPVLCLVLRTRALGWLATRPRTRRRAIRPTRSTTPSA